MCEPRQAPHIDILIRYTDAQIILGTYFVIHAIIFGFIFTRFITIEANTEPYFWVNFSLFLLATVLFIILIFIKNNGNFTKAIKSISDLVWNTWSFVAISILLLHLFHDKDILQTKLKIDDYIRQIGPIFSAILVSLVIPAAGGKVAVSLVETVDVFRRPRRQAAPAPAAQ